MILIDREAAAKVAETWKRASPLPDTIGGAEHNAACRIAAAIRALPSAVLEGRVIAADAMAEALRQLTTPYGNHVNAMVLGCSALAAYEAERNGKPVIASILKEG